MNKKLDWNKRNISDRLIYIICIVIALVVMVFTLLSAFHILDSDLFSKITTVLLNIEIIFLAIGTWKSNKVFSIVGFCIAIILIIITLT